MMTIEMLLSNYRAKADNAEKLEKQAQRARELADEALKKLEVESRKLGFAVNVL